MSEYSVCPKCGERVHKDAVIMDHEPASWNSPMRQCLEEFREKNGEPKPIDKPYHKRHAYRQHGGTSHFWLCGPLEEESDHEYYLRWVGALK